MVPYLNGKELSTHLQTVKINGDTIQDMKILHGHVPILFFVAANGLVVLPDFENLDESFSCRKELVPKPTDPSQIQCNRHFACIDKLSANRLVNGASNEDIVGKLAVQTKEEIQDMMKSDSRTEIVELILKNLVPKLGNNKLRYDPHIISKLRIQNNKSLKKLCA